MGTTIENSVQNHDVRKKNSEQSNPSKERARTDESQSQNSKDVIVDIQSSSLGSKESGKGSNDNKNVNDVEQPAKEVAGLVHSENEISFVEQGENNEKGNLIDIMV